MPSNRLILATLTAVAFTVTACEREPTPADSAVPHPAPVATGAPATEGSVLMLAQGDPDFTTLVSALQTAGMAATLNGPGPFTIFAPNNAAFEKIPAARRDALSSPAGQAELRQLLSYHVVPGRLDAAALAQRIQAGGGALTLTTLQGGTLTAGTDASGSITLTDSAGGVSRVVEAGMAAGNGVIYALDRVAEPG